MLFWWGMTGTTVLFLIYWAITGLAHYAGRRVKVGLAQAIASLFTALFILLSFSAWFGWHDRYFAIRLASLFGYLWVGAAIAALSTHLIRRLAARAPDGVLVLPSFLQAVTEPRPDQLPDAALGRPSGSIDVVTGGPTLTITMPVRRSLKTSVGGIVLIAPAAFSLGRLVVVFGAFILQGVDASTLAVFGSIGILGNLLMNIPFWLAGLWGAYLIWGEEHVIAEPHRLLVRKSVWGMQTTLGVLDVPRCAVAEPERDTMARWRVSVGLEAGVGGPRTSFGAGILSHEQAEALAGAVSEHYAQPALSV